MAKENGEIYLLLMMTYLGISKFSFIWDKVFKNRPSKICRRHPLKNLKGFCLPKADHTFFKGSLPQTLLSPFFDTLVQILNGF